MTAGNEKAMHIAYHISHDEGTFKNGDLAAGLVIELTKPFRGPSKPPPGDVAWWKENETTWNRALPDGVTFWGQKVLLNLLDDDFMLKREYFAEDIRQKQFPSLPSRLQVIFGCRTLDDAHTYRDGFAVPQAGIWKVSSEAMLERDMHWMRRVSNDGELVRNITKYWNGEESSASPRWECLLVPPVQVIERVA